MDCPHTLLDVITVRCGRYVFKINHNINSKWAIFGLCHYCIQWPILSLWAQQYVLKYFFF